jgi:hypothetical protein
MVQRHVGQASREAASACRPAGGRTLVDGLPSHTGGASVGHSTGRSSLFGCGDETPATIIGSGGQPLPGEVQARMGRSFGADFSDVRVHEGEQATAMGALAFAQGSDVSFAPGAYQPGTESGDRLLGHELAHVVQQRQGRVATPQGKGASINTDAGLEAEADDAGARAAAGERVDGAASATASATAAPSAGPIQRKVGFEVEVNILLSKGGRTRTPSTAAEEGDAGQRLHPPEQAPSSDPEILTQEAVKALDPATLESTYGARMLLVQGKKAVLAVRWDGSSTANTNATLRPNAVDASQPGRWVLIRNWSEDTQANAMFFDPLLDKSAKIFHATAGTPFDVVEDHAPQPLAGELGSLIELVTDPRDEFGEEAQFLAPMRRAVETVRTIEERTAGFTRRIPANQIFAGARTDLYLGHDGLSGQNHQGSIQATLGVKLGGVQRLMQSRTDDGWDVLREPVLLGRAMAAAAAAMARLGWQAEQHPGLSGLLHLVCMYLVSGHVDWRNLCSLDKNHVPFLIRHGVPSIRTAGLTLEERRLLADRAPAPPMDVYDLLCSRDPIEAGPSIVEILARAADRAPGDKLFAFSEKNVSVEEWVRAALFGDADPLMQGFWGEAREIPPEQVGLGEARGTGAILEQRHAAPGFVAPDGWEGVARQFYQKARAINRG